MKNIELGALQEKFTEIVWENEPISSGELVKLCEEKLHWKKSTTYTVLRKMCEKGILQNNGGIVNSVVSRKQYCHQKGEQVVKEFFKGSLPAFIASFTQKSSLSEEDISEIQELIDNYKKDRGL